MTKEIMTRLSESTVLQSVASPVPGSLPDLLIEAIPEQVAILPFTGPFTADGAGQLLFLVNSRDGYDVVRYAPEQSETFDLVYRRRSAVATSLAIGPDGTFCIGLTAGIDCVDPFGQVFNLEHDALRHIVSLAFTPDGGMWVLACEGPAYSRLRLALISPDLAEATHVLTLRDSIQGFGGTNVVGDTHGAALLPIVENEVPRILRVHPDGQFSRIGDYWNLSGGIAVDMDNTLYVSGVKRPQSLQEQSNPIDAVFLQTMDAAAHWTVQFPAAPGGPRLGNSMALGGDGTLYALRHQQVRTDAGPASEQPVLWSIDVQRPGLFGSSSRVIDFGIPFVDTVVDPRVDSSSYVGPLLVARGQTIVVDGINFEGKNGRRQLLIGEQPADIVSWSDETIVAAIPHNAVAGEANVIVAIDHVVSNEKTIEVKTPDVPGWFQIGSPGMAAGLTPEYAIRAYLGYVQIFGMTDQGVPIERTEQMDTPGLYTLRLPNGSYTAHFAADYVISDGLTIFVPMEVPAQTLHFRITDEEPIVLWLPEMLARGE